MTAGSQQPNSELAAAAHLPQTTAPVAQGDGDPGAVDAQTSEAPRRLAVRLMGRTVNYVMADGRLRPLVIVCARDGSGTVDGVLLFNGRIDAGQHPRGLVNDASGHLPSCAVLLQEVVLDDQTFAIGTWHFPTADAVMATSMDPHAFETMLLAAVERTIADEKRELVSLVNEKLAAQLQAVNETLDSFKGMVEGLVGGKAAAPAVEDGGIVGFGRDATDPAGQLGGLTPGKDIVGEQTANAAAAGSGDEASESGATQTAS